MTVVDGLLVLVGEEFADEMKGWALVRVNDIYRTIYVNHPKILCQVSIMLYLCRQNETVTDR